MHQVLSGNKRDYQRIIEEGYECCRKHHSESWILEPVDEFVGLYKGILFARADDEIPGAAFMFTLDIDASNLADQPRIHFEKNLEHPYIIPTPYGSGGNFCFPISVSCREKMEDILEKLAKYFFLRTKVNSCINADAGTKYRKNLKAFWAKLKEEGYLQPKILPEPPVEQQKA